MSSDETPKVIAIVGPTASGKSELAVALAKKYNGEIISCDSRQVYRGLNLGTGKIPGQWKKPVGQKNRGRDFSGRLGYFYYRGVAHHCIDFVDPKKQYSVALFQKAAQKAISEIVGRGKLPILCGGTGLWIDAVIYNQSIPEVKANPALRRKLEKLDIEQLYEKLKQLDPDRAAVIDWHNKRRLIRSLEIVLTTGRPLPKMKTQPGYDVLWLGIQPPQDALYKKIDLRLSQRIKSGMIDEVRRLHRQGLSWKRLEAFGLEYKYLALFLQKKLSEKQMLQQLSFAIKHYAKRQLTWWKRNAEIHWMPDGKKATELVVKFLE